MPSFRAVRHKNELQQDAAPLEVACCWKWPYEAPFIHDRHHQRLVQAKPPVEVLVFGGGLRRTPFQKIVDQNVQDVKHNPHFKNVQKFDRAKAGMPPLLESIADLQRPLGH